MRRIVTIGSIWAGLTCVAGAAAEDEVPALAPPAPGPSSGGAAPAELPPPIEAPPAPGPSSGRTRPAELPPPIEVPSAAGPGAILAVPGLPISGRPRARTTLPTLEPAGPVAADDLPLLIGPSQSPGSAPAAPPGPISTFPGNLPGGTRSPRVIESTPNPTGEGIERTPSPRGAVPPSGRRPPGFLGRLLAPYGVGRPAPEPDDAIRVEPRSDPATDAALKRRIEHQIRTTVGDRLKTFDVRVNGREVIVRARVARFWQRRNVRRAIETLPALSGLRPTLDVE